MTGDPITVVPSGAATYVVKLMGDIDLDEALELMDTIVPLAASGGAVELDLTGVTFLGSSGLRAIATARRAAEAAGGRVVVVATSHIAHRVLELTGMALLLSGDQPARRDPASAVAQARRMRSSQN